MMNPYHVSKDYSPPTPAHPPPQKAAYLGVGTADSQPAASSPALQFNPATGQPNPPASAMDRLTAKAVEAVETMVDNFMDATPFTREGMAKGMGTLAAELRGGLLDVQRLVVHAFPDSAQQEAVLGMVGMPTPGMVDQEREQEQSRGR